MDVDALYVRHRDALLVFLVRRTADTEVALDLWAETFAQAVASSRRYRGGSDAEAAAWLYTIAKRQLALYYRRGRAEQRALQKLRLERPPASDALLREIEERAAARPAPARAGAAHCGSRSPSRPAPRSSSRSRCRGAARTSTRSPPPARRSRPTARSCT